MRAGLGNIGSRRLHCASEKSVGRIDFPIAPTPARFRREVAVAGHVLSQPSNATFAEPSRRYQSQAMEGEFSAGL